MTVSPRHVAVIMDGNGRWAQGRGLSRSCGHEQGVKVARNLVLSLADSSLEFLTLYGFSLENWKRPGDEVESLMSLLRLELSKGLSSFQEKNVRIRFVGDRAFLDKDLVSLMQDVEKQTEMSDGLNLTLAVSYGGRADLVEAARRVRSSCVGDVNEKTFSDCLPTGFLPDVDLLVRTGGERRLSNFLLWHCSYAELFFVDDLWPDFDQEHFDRALAWFQNRRRRYGGVYDPI